MLLQTNSYIVPKEKRAEHTRLLRRFRQTLARLGCDHFEVFEQVGANWSTSGEPTGRYVQIMHFRDRKHQQQVQAAERADPAAQALINEFCQLINFPYQQQQGLFATGFYSSALPVGPGRAAAGAAGGAAEAAAGGTVEPQVEAEVAPPQADQQQPAVEPPAEANAITTVPRPPANGQHVEEELDLSVPNEEQNAAQGRGQYEQDYPEVSLLNLSGDVDDLGDLDLEADRQRPQPNRNGV